jgi:hypothetical protein
LRTEATSLSELLPGKSQKVMSDAENTAAATEKNAYKMPQEH